MLPPSGAAALGGIPAGHARGRSGGGGGAGGIAGSPEDLIEAATSEFLQGQPDWSANMAICDMLNNAPQVASVVIEALKERILSKKHSVGLTAVILLDSIVRNCQSAHHYVAQREFVEVTLVKSLPRSIRKPNQVQYISLAHCSIALALSCVKP